MKIAIVHDYLKEYGGAERVVETLLEIWPDAEVFTTVYSPEFLGPHRERVEKWKIHTSFLNKIPLKNKLISAFRLFGPWVFKCFDLSKFDVVIVSQSGTYVSPNIIKKSKKTIQVTYCHTPPRWLYGYKVAGNWDRGVKKIIRDIIGPIPMALFRIADLKAAQLSDYYIANSQEVSDRIKKFYGRDSIVIYPPVEIPAASIKSTEGESGYYLAGGRLARSKHTELAIEAANKLKFPLKIFGRSFSGFGKELQEIAGPTVEFLGELSEEDKWKYYKNAKAFLYPSEDEDFGIQAVESMAVGTPVVGYGKGGVLETVIEGKTGILFDSLTVSSLISAIKRFENTKISSDACVEQAKKFSKERFKSEMRGFVESKVNI
jgi:glycosyltransferase involved in cell wall biosynthesis